MLDQFKSLKAILKVQYYSIDNCVFKLHYRITFYIFMIASMLVTFKQYIGQHIQCISDGGVPEKAFNTYCFFTSTFTLPEYFNETLVKKGIVAHPGVGPMGPIMDEENIKRHTYYPWVPFVLFAQAIMFYFPHLLWKTYEGKNLKRLTEGLSHGIISETSGMACGNRRIMSNDEKHARLQCILEFLTNKGILRTSWSYCLILCEHINFLNVMLQAFLIHIFLNRQFFSLGSHVIVQGLEKNITILEQVFPKVTKCTFYKYGPSGTIQSHDALCIMALNVLNEKIYVILWFWLIFLFFCTGANLLYRYSSLMLHSRSKLFNKIVFSTLRSAKLSPWMYSAVTKRLSYTEWLFLNYLSANLDGIVFRDLFVMIADDVDRPRGYNYERNRTLPIEEENDILLEPIQNEEDNSSEEVRRLLVDNC